MQVMACGWRGGLAAGLLWAGRLVAAEPAAPAAGGNWPEIRDQTFAVVWETVNESYYDATFGGVDWAAVREKYRKALPDIADKEALRGLLFAMLGELRRTHFSIQPRELAVFTPAERTRMGTVGLDLVYVDDVVAVEAAKPASAASRAGIHAGDIILRADQVDFGRLGDYLKNTGVSPARRGLYLTALAVSRLRGAVGATVQLQVRSPDGQERPVGLTIEPTEGEWSEPMGDFPSVPVACTVSSGPAGLAYLRFNVFARQAMKDIRAALRLVPADGGLVIDLRGNPGGITVMAPGISGWLSDRTFLLGTMHMRQGHIGFTVSPQDKAFLGPVALLIDGGSASTSEIMAAGLQEAGRARVFGETSPGAALPSLFKALPTGDLLQYAIADLQTPGGVLIEGRGVVPDEMVLRTVADLAAGRDPVLAAAHRWLETERHKPSGAPPTAAKP
ncbi:MAG: S41 family peptidase [Lacunisphaera sp.]|nr:S41 family peptidase [Lacunisphaera sp.]